MSHIEELFSRNRAWSESVSKAQPDFFTESAKGQSPEYLWLGCADSRVPPNELLDLPPGEIFVHRNIANQVINTDFSCLAVMQYAIEVLKVKHVIVCGHYGCGGVQAAMGDQQFGLIDNWLAHIKAVYRRHEADLRELDSAAKFRKMCEINVAEQVKQVCLTTMVQNVWAAGQELTVHGVIYDLETGLLNPLQGPITSLADLQTKASDGVPSGQAS